MAWQKPTIGRIVLYTSYGTPGGEHSREDRAAVITAVTDDTTVSLCVMNPTGLFFNQQVYLGDPHPESGEYPGGTWHWPVRT